MTTTVATIAALRALTSSTTDTSVYVEGYASPCDGGEGMFAVQSGSSASDNGGTIIVDSATSPRRWVRQGSKGIIDVAWFGALGDGTDQTTSLQNAHSVWSARVNGGVPVKLLYPGGTYKITTSSASPLAMPGNDTSGWMLAGEGVVNLIQQSDNWPIFQILVATSGYMRDWEISGFVFSYANTQSSSDPKSIAISLGTSGNTGSGFYDFAIRRCIFQNCWRGISVDYDSYSAGLTCPIWGFEIEDVTSYTLMSGATIWLNTLGAGSPRGNIRNFYSQNANATEPAIVVKGMDSLYGENWEFNQGTGSNFSLQNFTNLIDSVRFEGVKMTTTNGYLGSVSGGQAVFTNMFLYNYTVTNTTGYNYVLDCYGADVAVENFTASNASLTTGATMFFPYIRNGGSFRGSGTWIRDSEGTAFYLWINTASAIDCYWGDRVGIDYAYLGMAPSLASVAMSAPGGSAAYAAAAPVEGYVTSVIGTLSNATGAAAPVTLSAGSVTIYVYVNGVAVGSGSFQAAISTGNATGQKNVPPFKAGFTVPTAHQVAAGDLIALRVSTSSDFAMTGGVTANLYAAAVISGVAG